MENLREMKVAELKEIAKELKVANWWNLKKEALIEGIEEKQIENAALAKYEKNWRKYTDRYNPRDFIERFRSGEIDLSDEELKAVNETKEVKPAQEEEPKRKNSTKQTPNALVQMPGTEDPNWGEKHWGSNEAKEHPSAKRGALIEFDGRSQNICAWAKELEISANTLYGRIYKMGWSVERAFTTPTKRK